MKFSKTKTTTFKYIISRYLYKGLKCIVLSSSKIAFDEISRFQVQKYVILL